jgi:curli biogenesis system outer membrane secretion channel CsgG
MKSHRLIAVALCFVLCSLIARAQDMDTALTKLTEDLAGKVKANGNKKIAVLDFTDLQGGSSELGKYISEQLTVDFVMTKRDFAVLDRANLKSILAEHKLTATGLVDPENAKQLGKFAGVDALIIGNIIPIGTNINLTAKIITTETAEVVGAAKTKFMSDDTVQQFLAHPAQANDSSGANATEPPPPKQFGDLLASVESLNVTPGDGHYGYATLTLIITNTSASLVYGVGVNPDFYHSFNLSNRRGDVFRATEVTGVGTIYQSFAGFSGSLTDISPKSAITIVAKSQVGWMGQAGEYRPYHFQTEVTFSPKTDGRYPEMRKYNVVLDIK